MSGLLGLLNLGAGALSAHNAGIAVTARNVANVNTPGYSRQTVNTQAQTGGLGGVQIGNATRLEDELLAMRERLADGNRGRLGSMSVAMAELEHSVAPAQGNLVQSIAALFGGILNLASAPMEEALRVDVLAKAREMTTSFNNAAQGIQTARSGANDRVANMTREVSRLTAQIAAANQALTTSRDPVIADKRDQAARQLSELVGGQARIDSDGMMRFVVGGGAVLVDGYRAATLEAVPDASMGGMVRIDVVDGNHRQNITTQIDGGKMAGELAFRDGVAAQAAQQLDQLAYDIATQMNGVHRANAGLDGISGVDLFVEPVEVAGAARHFALNPSVEADPRFLASASSGGVPSDNGGLLALAALKDMNLAGAAQRTFVDQAIVVIGNVGAAAASAQGGYELEIARSEVLANMRDGLSGVSLTEEAARLAQFQHASLAATQFVSVVNEMLGDLIRTL